MQKRFLILQVCLVLILTCFSSYIQAAGLTSLEESKAGYDSRVKAVMEGWASSDSVPIWMSGNELDLAVCLAKLAADTNIDQVNDHLVNNIQRGSDSDFYGVWLIRIYCLYKDKLMQAAKDRMLQVIEEIADITAPNQTHYGSENHWFQEQSNAYLYHQLTGEDTSGYRHYLLEAMHRRVKHDFTEINSPGYLGPTMRAIVNLYDFAEDPVVKKAAEVTLDFMWICYAVQSLDRMRGGPYGRSFHVDWRNDDWGHTYDALYWLSLVWLGNGDPTVRVMENPNKTTEWPHQPGSDYDANLVFSAASGYRIPDVVVDLAVDREGRAPFVYKGYHKGSLPIGGSGEWTEADCYHYYYHTPHYLLASGKVQGYHSMSRWDIVFDTDHLAFIKNMFDLNSVTQYENVVICSANQVEYSSSIDEVVEENKIIFFREGESFGTARRGVIEMGLASDYGSFASWKAHIKANTSLSDDTYISAKGDVIKFTTGQTIVSVNGKPYRPYTSWKFMDSPYVTSELNSAHIEVRKNGRELILDFSDAANPFKSGSSTELQAFASSDITEGASPLTVQFTGVASGGDGAYSYSWDFGDSVTAQGQTVSHTYQSEGIYPATLTVTDGRGTIDSDTIIIEVSVAPVLPGVPIRLILPSAQTAGSQFEVDIQLGDAAHPIADLFGISFCLFYPTQHLSLVSTDNEGILGSDLISILTPDESQGKIRIGLSRKNPSGGFDGYGHLMSLRFIISGHSVGETLTLYLDKITATNSGGHLIESYSFPAQTTVTNLLVWPGDLNNDGEVNEIDILPVGLYWLLEGPVRPNASYNWEAQPASAWDPISAAYADANGDGVVDEREIIVIGLNWNQDWSQGQGLATLNPGRTLNSNPLDAYRTIYRFIRDVPESEAITRIKTLLSSLITADIPLSSKLFQNYPNPGNLETWIPFTLDKEDTVLINIYDLSGRLIRTLDMGTTPPGEYIKKERAAYWDGKDMAGKGVSSGVYWYEFKTGKTIFTRKMMILN